MLNSNKLDISQYFMDRNRGEQRIKGEWFDRCIKVFRVERSGDPNDTDSPVGTDLPNSPGS
jgi:hypothetical protein